MPLISTLHIVLPGLLDTVAGEYPATPALNLLLTRARVDRISASGFPATLFSFFGYDLSTERDLPSAALSRLGEGGSPEEGCWLHADPVHIHPLQDRLVLFGNAGLDVTREEADSLVETVNQAFRNDGWRMEVAAPDRWYLRVPKEAVISTSPLHDATGRDVKTCLPGGCEGETWRRALNEIQMLFHATDINRLREERGQRPINSVWFSGAGRLPDRIDAPFEHVVSGHPLAKGFARLSGAQLFDPSVRFSDFIQNQRGAQDLLWVDAGLWQSMLGPGPAGRADWIEGVEALLSEIASGLRSRRIGQLAVYPCDGRCFKAGGTDLKRFWKRPRPLRDFISDDSRAH